jgi:hypothetical protein
MQQFKCSVLTENKEVFPMKLHFFRRFFCLLLCFLLIGSLPVHAAAVRFSDVPSSYWAMDSINQAVNLGFIKGETASRFGVGHKMTRAAFAVVLCRAFGWNMVQPESGTFTDNQDSSAWYFSAVETACANGAVTTQSAAFRPNEAITREEAAVMLVRALGYTSIAGLDLNLTCPFSDVDTNEGYLTMAYHLGIISGNSGGRFCPDAAAMREQAVVMLMRAYACHVQKPTELLGIAFAPSDSFSGFSAVGVDGLLLTNSTDAAPAAAGKAENADAIRDAVHAAGAKALLRVTGSIYALRCANANTAAALADAVASGGWDGLILDVPQQTAEERAYYSQLAAALNTALGDRLLYIVADAPTLTGTYYGAYDYVALAAAADRLIIRAVAPAARVVNGFPISPLDPLEEIYYALAVLKGAGVSPAKLSLLMTSTGAGWTGSSADGSVSASEIQSLLKGSAATQHRSERYANAYLTCGAQTVWYLDAESATARTQLCAFFNVCSVCVSDLSSVADYGDGSLLNGLR